METRHAGVPAYSLKKSWNLAKDGILPFTNLPHHLALFTSAWGFLILIYWAISDQPLVGICHEKSITFLFVALVFMMSVSLVSVAMVLWQSRKLLDILRNDKQVVVRHSELD